MVKSKIDVKKYPKKDKKQFGGRPPKYTNKEKIEKVYEYLEMCEKEAKFPSIAGFAVYMDVIRETIYDWMDNNKKLSLTIKKILSRQEAILQEGISPMSSAKNVAGGIFLLKANHGYKDRTDIDITSGGRRLPTPILAVSTDVHSDDSDKEDPESSEEN